MYNSGNPVIHKVRASEDNERAMELMGIEFLNPARGQGSSSTSLKSLKTDYEDDTICVVRVRFSSGLPHIEDSLRFVGIVIVLKGPMRIVASSPGDPTCVNHDLKEGNLLWNDGGVQFTFSALEGSEAEALVVLMKSCDTL
jgi:hypothetical protein